MKLTEDQIKGIEDMLSNGSSNREAARAILDKEGRESTIRNYIKTGVISKEIGSELSQDEKPRMLVIDIETAPVLAHVWGLFKQNVGLNMIDRDWFILSYAAKWVGEDEVFYSDKRDSFDSEDDTEMLEEVWKLLDEADIVIGQNSVRFDMKKLNSRFIINGMKPPSHYRQVDTLLMAKRHFGFTSNKLEYMTDKLCTRYKKSTHGKFTGFELWKQCLAGNQEAWEEMQDYNSRDILSTEELYFKLAPWSNNHPNINAYHDREETFCTCGSNSWTPAGYHLTNTSKYLKMVCDSCGATQRDRVNLLPKDKRKSLKANVV